MGIDAEAVEDDALEVLHEVVGEVEGGRVFVVHGVEHLLSGEELVAVRPGKHLDAFLGGDFGEFAGRAAVAVPEQDAVVVSASPFETGPHGIRDLRRPVVQDARQALERDVAQSVKSRDVTDLGGQRAAGQDQHLRRVDGLHEQ